MTKAKKVTPPTDMDAHNANLRDDTRSTAEVESDEASPLAVLTTAEVAAKLETTPRQLRKFLRSKGSGVEPVGQGKRYALTEQSIPALAKRFDAWSSRDSAERKAEAEGVVEIDPDTVEDDTVDEIVEIDTDDAPEGDDPVWTVAELEELTVAQLRDVAADHEVDLPTKAKKAEIVSILTDALVD